jgi:hypothetical protein
MLEPRLPPDAAGLRLGLTLPHRQLRLELHVLEDEHLEGQVTRGGRTAELRVVNGRRIDLDAVLDG